jgi:ATP-dependent DNA helicase RecQ
LIARGLLEADAEGYGTLHLTAAATPVLKGEVPVMVRADSVAARSERRARKATRAAATQLDAGAQPLWDALRALRAKLAREQGVPAYVIFHDATLREMLAARPRTREELADVSGVGAHKLERYGEAFLHVLKGEQGAGSRG